MQGGPPHLSPADLGSAVLSIVCDLERLPARIDQLLQPTLREELLDAHAALALF